MLPGQVLEYDFRPVKTVNAASSLKVLQWNVERNYKADAIIVTIKNLDPDVVILQEIDIVCKRSGNRNHLEEMCKALAVKGGFVCEFVELDSSIRRPHDEGGGFHGNAILSKFDIEFRVIQHERHAFDWDRDGEKLREPRVGNRFTLVGKVQSQPLPPILFYCVHLEVFTGIIGRVSVFSEILEDAAKHTDETPHQAIFGDLNTMAHTIVRLSPRYAQDRYRIMSIGQTESAWWDSHLFDFHRDDGPVNTRLACASLFYYPRCLSMLLSRFVNGGFEAEVLQMARNPGFYDPWGPDFITLHNPRYFGLFKGKLDWTLLRNLKTVEKLCGNTDYSASDHAYLMLRIAPDNLQRVSRKEQYNLWRTRRAQYNKKPQWWENIFILVTVLGAVAIGIQTVYYSIPSDR